MDELFNSNLGRTSSRTSRKKTKGGRAWAPSRGITVLAYLYSFFYGGELVKAQPPADLDPADTEAIIAAFLNDATAQQWGDEEVNNVLEHILRQDAEPGQEAIPVPTPFHGPNSPISTPTQPDEEEGEEEEREDEQVEEETPIPNSATVQEGEHSAAGAVSTVHTAQGTTTAWISVLDFDRDMSKFYKIPCPGGGR